MAPQSSIVISSPQDDMITSAVITESAAALIEEEIKEDRALRYSEYVDVGVEDIDLQISSSPNRFNQADLARSIEDFKEITDDGELSGLKSALKALGSKMGYKKVSDKER